MCSRPNQCCSAGHGVSGEPGPSCGRTRPKLLSLDSKFSELICGGNSLKAVAGFVGCVYQKHLWIPPEALVLMVDDDTSDDSDSFMWSRIIFRPFLFLFSHKRVPVYSGDTIVGCVSVEAVQWLWIDHLKGSRDVRDEKGLLSTVTSQQCHITCCMALHL